MVFSFGTVKKKRVARRDIATSQCLCDLCSRITKSTGRPNWRASKNIQRGARKTKQQRVTGKIVVFCIFPSHKPFMIYRIMRVFNSNMF